MVHHILLVIAPAQRLCQLGIQNLYGPYFLKLYTSLYEEKFSVVYFIWFLVWRALTLINTNLTRIVQY